jgi:hypothetical protein
VSAIGKSKTPVRYPTIGLICGGVGCIAVALVPIYAREQLIAMTLGDDLIGTEIALL